MFFSIHGGVGACHIARAEDKECISWTRNMVGIFLTNLFASDLVLMLLGCIRGIIRSALIVKIGERWWTRRDDIVCTVMRIGGPFVSYSIISPIGTVLRWRSLHTTRTHVVTIFSLLNIVGGKHDTWCDKNENERWWIGRIMGGFTSTLYLWDAYSSRNCDVLIDFRL